MDLFTHVILGYLISYGIVGFQPQYLAAGALAGGLPDADIIFFPLAKRFPILRHHGITHSIFGVTAVALVGGLVFAPMIAPGVPLLYFVVMEAAGLGHMLGDAFTHFSVAPLLPFSERPLELDADRAINFITLAASVTSLFLLGFERFRVPFGLYLLTIYGMMVFYGGYLGIRLIGRAGIARVRRALPEFNIVAPTANPFVWMLLYEQREGGRHRSGFLRYRLGHGVVDGPYRVDVPLEGAAAPTSGPVGSAAEALERSYPLARRTSDVLDNTYHFAQVKPEGNGGWDIVWYSLEFAAFGRAAAVRVTIGPDGSIAAKSAWFPVPRTPYPS
ncbi:MAG TPA: metal-dependent hydrolase [Thermoplasmata archaeon]|nr:metal-dependent hydrolase [Thermoplasmata archaeon]